MTMLEDMPDPFPLIVSKGVAGNAGDLVVHYIVPIEKSPVIWAGEVARIGIGVGVRAVIACLAIVV